VETSVNRLFELIARSLDYHGAPEHVSTVPGEQRRSVLDGSSVRRDLGVPAWTSLEKGIVTTAEAFRRERRSSA